MIDPILESRVMNRLQSRKNGQTIEQLQEALNESQARILVVLKQYQKEGYITMSETGVWKLP
jgi:hypothetical protein